MVTGNAEAQYCLGLMYETGKGVGIDIFEAVMWYRKSKAKGFALAERKLLELGYNQKRRSYFIYLL